jgi:hypothetical protein
MDEATRAALVALHPPAPEYTIQAFHVIDGVWWSSKMRLPEKHLVMRRNMDLGLQITP